MSGKKQVAILEPEDAHAALLVLDDYVDDASMDMRESLIRVCRELRPIAEERDET